MPDHFHLLWLGIDPRADQLAALEGLRRKFNRISKTVALQDQAFDHVLREQDRHRDAFRTVAHYILANPMRSGLVETWEEWPFSGAVFPGYPDLNPRKRHFWENFWKAFEKQSR